MFLTLLSPRQIIFLSSILNIYSKSTCFFLSICTFFFVIHLPCMISNITRVCIFSIWQMIIQCTYIVSELSIFLIYILKIYLEIFFSALLIICMITSTTTTRFICIIKIHMNILLSKE